MRIVRELDRKGLAGVFVALSVGIMLLSLPATASAAPTGSSFDHIVIVAMENQNYGSVIGSSSAPFINSLAKLGTTISNYHSYGQNIGGCSAGCYEAFTSGQQTHSDGWCPRSSSPCYTISNIADQLHTAGLTSAMFCEDGCPRGADHFPWIAYTSTWNSCLAASGGISCSGQTGPDGNLLYNSQSSGGNTAFTNYLNSATPANYIWFTPTDSHNMHDNSVSSGDAYLQQLLVGSGSIASPSTGSVLSTNLFKTPGTFLYIWWDEYDPSPNVEYGSMIKIGYTSTGGYDQYDSLHTIEANWGLPYITSVVSGDTGMTNIFGSSIPPAPGALTASFTTSLTVPLSGQSVTFTATTSGGTSPYTYSWNLGGTGKTGNPVSQSFTNGSYTIKLTVTDSAGTSLSSSQTLTVSSNPGSSTSSGSTVPVLIGWGGIRLDEAAVGGGINTPSNPPASKVFSGESASNMELVRIEMKSMGYNTVRVDFDPYCTSSQYMSAYSATNLQRAIQIAKYYGFWIIVDYHGYSEPFNSSQASCWLNFWSGVTNQFKNSYPQIIWEPLNEPCYNASSCAGSGTTNDMCSGASACVSTLSNEYQLWIAQTRAQSDTHWIVVQNICSYGCSLSDWASGFPTVTDPLGAFPHGKVFLSLHSYMGYSSGSWDNSTAESVAQQYYQAVVAGMKATGWPALNTEGGADPLCTSCAPDQVLTGSSGYTVVTFHFIQTLTSLYDSSTPQRISWIWWPAGSWTNTPGAGEYGALQCNSKPVGWGCLLKYTTPSNHLPIIAAPGVERATVGGTLHFTVSASSPDGGTITLAASGLVSGMTFDPATGSFSFTPNQAQAGQTVTVSFTATNSNDPAWTSTQSVPIQVEKASTSSPGVCLACLLPQGLSTTIWLLVVGVLIGIVASLVLFHVKTGAALATAKRRRQNASVAHERVQTGKPSARQYRTAIRSRQARSTRTG